MNEREREVFEIIIRHYLNNGESVGSRTLEKKYNMGVSSATIRNVMSDLENMGLITKTHTSSGRIPTLEGYKMYIDELLEVTEINDEIKEQIFSKYRNRINTTDIIFSETVKLLSEISKGAAIALEPSSDDENIKKIQFVRITSTDVFVVAVMKNNMVKTSVLTMSTFVTEENISNLNEYINDLLSTTHRKFSLKDLEAFLKNIGSTDLESEERKIFDKNKIFVDGTVNLLCETEIELPSIVNALKTISDKDKLKQIFKDLAADLKYDTSKVHVVFGDDLEYKEFKDYVIILKCYEFENEIGVLGIITQTRVNYSKIVAILDTVVEMLKKMLYQNNANKFLEYKI